MVHDGMMNEGSIDQSEDPSLEQRITALEERNEELETQLEQQQNGGISNMTRRGALGVLGGGALLGAAGSASAQPSNGNGGPPFADEDHDHSGDYLGEGEPVDRLDVNDLNTNSISDVTILRNELDESEVREKVANAPPGSVFVIEPGAQWTLTDTLIPPKKAIIYGYRQINGGGDQQFIFNRGFNGPLLETRGFLRLESVSFSGEYIAGGYTGPIIRVTADREAINRQHHFRDVIARDASPNDAAVELRIPYICKFDHCAFFDSGYGLLYYDTGFSHHGQNLFTRCWIGRCGTGVKYERSIKDEEYINCTINKCDVAFEQDSPGYAINVRVTSGNLSNNGIIWLQRQGTSASIAFEQCQMNGSHSGAPTDLTSPVGLFHVEDGTTGIGLYGGYTNGDNDVLYAEHSGASGDSILQVSGSSNVYRLTGNIEGTNTLLAMPNAHAQEGDIDVKSGIGLDPASGSVESYE